MNTKEEQRSFIGWYLGHNR